MGKGVATFSLEGKPLERGSPHLNIRVTRSCCNLQTVASVIDPDPVGVRSSYRYPGRLMQIAQLPVRAESSL